MQICTAWNALMASAVELRFMLSARGRLGATMRPFSPADIRAGVISACAVSLLRMQPATQSRIAPQSAQCGW